MRKIKSILIALLVSLSLLSPIAAYSQGNVTYQGNASGFVFKPGSDKSPTDLFPNFKDVMPGDSVSDKIEVKNGSTKTVKLYLRALAPENNSEFLSEMNLTVKASNTTSNAPANQAAGLSNWVLLGEFKPGGSTTLDVTIDIPVTMSNEYQKSVGTIVWEFKAEEMAGTGTYVPGTGDSNNLLLYGGLFMISVCSVYVLNRWRKKYQ